LASFKIVSFSSLLNNIEKQETIHTREKTAILTEIDTLEAAVQQQKLESLTREKNLSLQQKATNDFVSRIRSPRAKRKLKMNGSNFKKIKNLSSPKS